MLQKNADICFDVSQGCIYVFIVLSYLKLTAVQTCKEKQQH